MCQQLAREGASVAVAGNILSDCQETVSALQTESGSSGASFHPVEVDISDSGQVSHLLSVLANKFTGKASETHTHTYTVKVTEKPNTITIIIFPLKLKWKR